ncbi:MAG: hypothetical protein LUD73_01860, partial [Lachnospiraceae bacterium]|nr:hypothetical protein [Lachnospiraceae bacterium]
MCYTDQEQTLNKTKSAEPVSIQVQQTETQQVNTAAAPGAEVLLTRNVETQRERQQNATLNQEIRRELSAAQAQEAAAGTPIQEERPAQMRYKQRRREKKKAEAARKGSPAGNAVSYDMLTALQSRSEEKCNAEAPHKQRIAESGVDSRVLRAFTKGYQLRRRRPATAQDAANKAADDQFYADYCSNDVMKRKPHLERMVTELTNIHFVPEMFTERYLREHMKEMGELASKMLCMDNVMNDPINRPFFENLDPYRKAALDAGFRRIFIPFQTALLQTTAKYGVNFNRNKYYGHEEREPIEMGEATAEDAKRLYQDSIGGYEEELANLKEEQAQRVRDTAGAYAARMDAGVALLRRMQNDPWLGLQPGEEYSPFFSRSHVLLQMGDEFYEQNLETMRTLLEVKRLGDARPSRDLYERVRTLVAPRVEKVMSCDVEALAFLTDEALMLHSAELGELFLDNMFVDDLMKILHPSATAPLENNPTPALKDELTEPGGSEFAYKQNMIHGLFERSRALASRRYMETEGTTEGLFSMAEKQRGVEENPQRWAEERLDVGTRMVEANSEQRVQRLTPGTEAFQKMITRNTEKIMVLRSILDAASPLISARADLRDEKTPEAKKVMRRLKYKDYYSLRSSQAELRQLGIEDNDIREPLFRSFTGFMGTEAARKLLTPEKARAMILDLGAGAEMHKGEWLSVRIENEVTIQEILPG